MNYKLSVVIPVLNQHDMAKAVYAEIVKNTNTVEREVEFIIVDNGSTPALEHVNFPGAFILRRDKSIGVYPTFQFGFEQASGDVIAFFHSDFVVWEQNWNVRVIKQFEDNWKVGMIGFIGSNEIDNAGGRGLGTTSSFMGKSLSATVVNADGSVGQKTWHGSAAHIHGKVSKGVSKAAVVDGCSMIITREAWKRIGFRDDFPLHHFYDRLISTQLLEKGFEIEVMGIECDHFSGQTVNQEGHYHETARKWCEANVNPAFFVKNLDGSFNWDMTIYNAAERMWLHEYRGKNLIPTRV